VKPLTFGSLFAGIGGFDLGFERAGIVCSWQVEINGFCQKVLARHWPTVYRHDDIRTFPPAPLKQWRVDVICGGFPCQDISLAGRGAGIEGKQSGLWTEFTRVVRLLQPIYVVVENVAHLPHRGLPRVLGDLAQLRYDAEWTVLPATAVGAFHIRPRLFVVAYSQRNGRDRVHERQQTGRVASHPGVSSKDVSHRSAPSYPPLIFERIAERCADARATVGVGQWGTEPEVERVVNGLPRGLVRPQLISLGNAVVPQLAEVIGRLVVEHHSACLSTQR
jgi:DNA (cytosine-5)-methyltransferase 1